MIRGKKSLPFLIVACGTEDKRTKINEEKLIKRLIKGLKKEKVVKTKKK